MRAHNWRNTLNSHRSHHSHQSEHSRKDFQKTTVLKCNQIRCNILLNDQSVSESVLMLSFTEVFVVFVMALIMFMYVQNHYGEVEYVRSSIDERSYLVQKLADKEKAADFLAEINKTLTSLVRHMMARFPDNADIIRLYDNYNPDAISEGSAESGYTSYSVNKGEKLILCIRQKDKSFVDMNTILYVAIHEIAHIMTSEIGHTTMFWDNFKFLLNEAIEVGLYKKVDYANKPRDYCGIKITNSIV